MCLGETKWMALGSTTSCARKWDYCGTVFVKDEDLTGGQWLSASSWLPGWKVRCQSDQRFYFSVLKNFFPSNDRHKIKRKSSRMKQLCTSKSTDFLRLKPGTLKTPLTLYEKDFCVNHQTPDDSGFGSRPLVKWKHVWIFRHFRAMSLSHSIL